MSNAGPYRMPAPKPAIKKEKFWLKIKNRVGSMFYLIKEWLLWFIFETPGGFLSAVIAILLIIGYAGSHESEATRMHAEHDRYAMRQEICRVHRAWYAPSQTYQGLMACRRLSDHSVFYVVETTGLELNPQEMENE